MREIKYSCGCKLGESGVQICTLHLVVFGDLLNKEDYKGFGWEINQETYNKIVHCLNVEQQERIGVNREWKSMK